MSDPSARPRPRSQGLTRRGLLVGGGAAMLGTAVGVGFGVAGSTSSLPEMSPAAVATAGRELRAAIVAERRLIASSLRARSATAGRRRTVLDEIYRDHLAHLRALQAVLADVRYPAAPSASAPPVTLSPGPMSTGALQTAEARASRAAAARALRLQATPAVVLATIAASEAAHAEALR